MEKVRHGKVSICPSKTLDQMVTGFIENPFWSSNAKDNDHALVSVKGKVMVHEKKTPVILSFLLNKEKSVFNFEEFYLDGKKEMPLIGVGILINMCRSK